MISRNIEKVVESNDSSEISIHQKAEDKIIEIKGGDILTSVGSFSDRFR